MRLICKIVILLLFSVCAPQRVLADVRISLPNGDYVTAYKNSYALLLGGSNYRYWPELGRVPTDIESISNSLIKQHYEVLPPVIDKSGAATRDAIHNFIVSHGGRDNRLFIFFGGHGDTVTNPKNHIREGFLVAADSPDPTFDYDTFSKTAISLSWLKKEITSNPENQILLVLDACFSGEIFGSRSMSSQDIQNYLDHKTRPVVQVITAADRDSKAPAVSELVPALIDGINGKADLLNTKFITGMELGEYVTYAVSKKSKVIPEFNSISGEGDLVVANELKAGSAVLPQTDPRFSQIRIRYYPKSGDGPKVRDALHGTNIRFEEVPSILSEADYSLSTSQVACHPSVPIDAVKRVALALISAGVPIRSVVQPTVRKDQNVNVIQVLHSGTKHGRKLTAADINSLTSCPVDFHF